MDSAASIDSGSCSAAAETISKSIVAECPDASCSEVGHPSRGIDSRKNRVTGGESHFDSGRLGAAAKGLFLPAQR
jgi:hypothetical protein